MKKFTKVCLIISLVLVLIGGTICAIGAVSGGWKLVNEMGHGRLWSELDRIGGGYWMDQWYENWDELEEVADDWEDMEDGAALEVLQNITLENVNDLEISIGGASLYVQESEDGTFGFKTEGNGKYKCYESGGVLHVEGGENHTIINNEERIYLTIPKGITFGDVNIAVGAGLVKLPAITADEMEIAIGAGKMEADGITGRNLLLETGAGQATLKNVEVDELNINVGMGESYVQGSVEEEINVECGMGRTELDLLGNEDDFNYEVSCAAGSISIGDKSYNGLAEDTYIDNDASKECNIDCAMGSIRVSFE